MHKDLQYWQFVADVLEQNQNVMVLVVAESSGSSPGRQGYKMAVSENGQLNGSIGGGVMEVNLVEKSRSMLSAGRDGTYRASLTNQVHRKGDPDSSGMICSGKQTVIFRLLHPENIDTVRRAIVSILDHNRDVLRLSPDIFSVSKQGDDRSHENFGLELGGDGDFLYSETLGAKSDLYIIGGGHCALALSELMSKMDFHISLFDDRSDLNTIDKNRFASEIRIIDDYESIGEHIRPATNAYVVVMTLGYRSDETVIRKLFDKEFKYFGVLGSRAKMGTLLKALKDDGFPADKLARIRTPIGLQINSRTPEEIAVSIAAEIISVKNAD